MKTLEEVRAVIPVTGLWEMMQGAHLGCVSCWSSAGVGRMGHSGARLARETPR